MADPGAEDLDRLLEEIQAISERRKPLEDRLRVMEEKKSLTLPAIYEKVRTETEARLAEVTAEAERLRDRILGARTAAVSQHQELEAELRTANEALEEIEFRQTLGEYSEEQYQQLKDERSARINEVEQRIQPVEEFLELTCELIASEPAVPDPAPVTEAAAVEELPKPPEAVVPASLDSEPSTLPDQALRAARSPSSHSDLANYDALFGAISPDEAAPLAGAPRTMQAPAMKATTTGPTDGSPPFPSLPALEPEETTQELGIRGAELPDTGRGRPFQPVLEVQSKDHDRVEDSWKLGDGETLIGRSPDNDIILLEESVSRRHARIVVHGHEVTFEDLGSANGSFINSERVPARQPRTLQDNDVVKFGQLLARFRISPED